MSKGSLACAQTAGNQCAEPVAGEYNGTFSITSMGGVATTFLLKWFRQLQQADRHQQECTAAAKRQRQPLGPTDGACACPALASGRPRRHLVSCHVEDDGVFKHLVEPSALNSFPDHRAVYIVGDPVHAVTSVFRRNFQCWHFYRLNNCWFTRAQRNGLIPCEQPGVLSFRRIFGDAASHCRRPQVGPLSSVAAYAAHGEDLFNASEQFRAWLTCRRPRCNFDILVLRYETLAESLPALFDFLELPTAARLAFPRVQRHTHADEAESDVLHDIYAPLTQVVRQIPPTGLLLKNRDRDVHSARAASTSNLRPYVTFT